ncbi:Coiled-coil domain-containing protein 25 [Myotis brandtii]|uniref:Coiled-coil domain-containing protein 25 n=1 Tax=Myotis brandtii TaxID=109478 RepID=S7MU72_MYOBR|nr:Coiled-coil domain-containing protein 25 [Myotis brandtii]
MAPRACVMTRPNVRRKCAQRLQGTGGLGVWYPELRELGGAAPRWSRRAAATMVFYFTSSVNSSAYTIYMGKDKYESKFSKAFDFEISRRFHVDKLSSAHVYLRLHKGENIEDIPKDVLMDCAQLVKANSIQGCKMNNVNVVYTPWSNLKKTADMDVGQIGFHRQKDVKIVTVEKKVNEILNRLEKTKTERFPDLAAEKECRDREERNEKKAQIQEMKRREKEEMKKKREMDELRSYSSLMKAENMSSNQVCSSICSNVVP